MPEKPCGDSEFGLGALRRMLAEIVMFAGATHFSPNLSHDIWFDLRDTAGPGRDEMGWRDGQSRNRARNRDFSGSEMGLNKSGRQLSDATYGFSLGPTLATIGLYLHVERDTLVFGLLGKRPSRIGWKR